MIEKIFIMMKFQKKNILMESGMPFPIKGILSPCNDWM